MVQPAGDDLTKAIALLNEGKVIAIPTETVYGLAADALNPDAVMQIFRIKKRPVFDPLIVHLSGAAEVGKYVLSFPEKARLLAKQFWPGPLTLILPKNKVIPDLVTSGLPFVGLRVPRHELTLNLLRRLNFPLAAPSANPFGYVSPTTAKHVQDQLGNQIELILDGGPCAVGLESTIVFFEDDREPKILRLGGITVEQIERVVGSVTLEIATHSKPNAPGQLDKHYATHSPMRWLTETPVNTLNPGKTLAILFQKPLDFLPPPNQFILSPEGSTEEAARNLFRMMRSADDLNPDLILAEKMPESGLGPAINDRLSRAMNR